MAERRLELDVGNTAIKWRKCVAAEVLAEGRLGFERLPELLDVIADVSEVWVASVASDQRNRELEVFFAERGLSCQFAQSQSRCGGLRNAYVDVSRMGVDRWLAMVAAFAEFGRACLVVDVGTALTIDLIDDAGQHLGGFIIPGPQMLTDALVAGTDRVRFDQALEPSVMPGCSTAACVHNGKWLVVVASIRQACVQLQQLCGQVPEVVVAGGAAPAVVTLAEGLGEAWQYRPQLVLDGLAPVLAAELD